MKLQHIFACYLFLLSAFTIASEWELPRLNQADFDNLAQQITDNFKSGNLSYFKAQPEIYLPLTYKHNYINTMQFLLNIESKDKKAVVESSPHNSQPKPHSTNNFLKKRISISQ